MYSFEVDCSTSNLKHCFHWNELKLHHYPSYLLNTSNANSKSEASAMNLIVNLVTSLFWPNKASEVTTVQETTLVVQIEFRNENTYYTTTCSR